MISYLFLELTNHCNMNCNFCPNHLMTRARGYMSTELAKKIIDQLKEMKFHGTLLTNLMGERIRIDCAKPQSYSFGWTSPKSAHNLQLENIFFESDYRKNNLVYESVR